MKRYEKHSTTHSEERVVERLGINKKSAIRYIELAVERGITADDCSGKDEAEYLRSKEGRGGYAILYNGNIFVVSTDEYQSVLTAYRAPSWFGKKRRYYQKTRIRCSPRRALANGLLG